MHGVYKHMPPSGQLSKQRVRSAVNIRIAPDAPDFLALLKSVKLRFIKSSYDCTSVVWTSLCPSGHTGEVLNYVFMLYKASRAPGCHYISDISSRVLWNFWHSAAFPVKKSYKQGE